MVSSVLRRLNSVWVDDIILQMLGLMIFLTLLMMVSSDLSFHVDKKDLDYLFKEYYTSFAIIQQTF